VIVVLPPPGMPVTITQDADDCVDTARGLAPRRPGEIAALGVLVESHVLSARAASECRSPSSYVPLSGATLSCQTCSPRSSIPAGRIPIRRATRSDGEW